VWWAGLLTAALLASAGPARAADVRPGETFRIPYQLTETQHILVRAKINGQGTFHFIVDTGAPTLYVGTEAAKKLGVKPDKRGWGTFARFELEGGLVLENVRGRIEDPFQLVGMNKMNLPGIRYDGVIGYTVLAQFRIQYDFTRPHLVWTKLDWEPPPPKGLMEMGGKPSAENNMMSMLVQLMALFMGKQPDREVVYRGFLGIELREEAGQVVVVRVLPDSPAAEAGVKAGDRLLHVAGAEVESLAALHKQAAAHKAGADVPIEVLRGGTKITLTLKATRGL
jgi:hypothetical protein